jgi:hypothetical protein
LAGFFCTKETLDIRDKVLKKYGEGYGKLISDAFDYLRENYKQVGVYDVSPAIFKHFKEYARTKRRINFDDFATFLSSKNPQRNEYHTERGLSRRHMSRVKKALVYANIIDESNKVLKINNELLDIALLSTIKLNETYENKPDKQETTSGDDGVQEVTSGLPKNTPKLCNISTSEGYRYTPQGGEGGQVVEFSGILDGSEQKGPYKNTRPSEMG